MDWAVVVTAGFLGGMLNAVAGGGSFITLPALIFVGVPPIAANATGTAALLPGYLASAWRFRRDVEFPANIGVAGVMGAAIAGGCVGAFALLLTNDQLFSGLIPWLILFATLAFVFGPRLMTLGGEPISETSRMNQLKAVLILFSVCLYGGYFNGGMGIILLAAFGFLGQSNLHGMNGLKNVVSAVLTAVAVVVYGVGAVIDYQYLLVLAVAAVAGGYAGASVAYRISQKNLRYFIVLIGLLMSVVFFVRIL
ncbi:MAG: sulfite exporter TauE/SafE family protein [Pseudomonadota bacterium]